MDKLKIGRFAKNIGVTPDFIKYYEEQNLLKPDKSESGYRYLSFRDSSRIIQFLRLRNYGFNVKEITEILNCQDISKIESIICQQLQEVNKSLSFSNAVADSLENLRLDNELGLKNYWSIEEVDEFYIHINSNGYEFIETDEVQNNTKEINQWMPLVNSIAMVEPFSVDNLDEAETSNFYFGLSISKKYVDQLHIPMLSTLKLIKKQRYLIYHSAGLLDRTTSVIKKGLHKNFLLEPMKLVKEHNYEICGNMFIKYNLNSSMQDINFINTTVYIPIK